MVLVPLTLFGTTVVVPVWNRGGGGYVFALVDEKDGLAASARRWFLHGTEGYATTMENGRKLRLHRLVLGPIEAGQVIDHVNGRKLDNRSANLRAVDKSKNGLNRHRPNSNNKRSSTPGVSWSTAEQKWKVQIRKQGKDHFGGYFIAEEEARQAATRLRSRLLNDNDDSCRP